MSEVCPEVCPDADACVVGHPCALFPAPTVEPHGLNAAEALMVAHLVDAADPVNHRLLCRCDHVWRTSNEYAAHVAAAITTPSQLATRPTAERDERRGEEV